MQSGAASESASLAEEQNTISVASFTDRSTSADIDDRAVEVSDGICLLGIIWKGISKN